MDEGENALLKAEKELVTQWIRTYRITAARSIGDKVSTTSSQILTFEEVVDAMEVVSA
jgi:hypothetical protein